MVANGFSTDTFLTFRQALPLDGNAARAEMVGASSKAANFLLDFRGEATADQPSVDNPVSWWEAA